MANGHTVDNGCKGGLEYICHLTYIQLKIHLQEREFEMTPLQELLQGMTCEIPEDRLTARQALDAFAVIEQDCRDLAANMP